MFRRCLLVVMLLAAGCGGDEPAPRPQRVQQPGTIEIDGQSATDRGLYSATGSEEVAVAAGNYFFEPTVITGSPGLELQLAVSAASGRHNLTLEAQEVDEELPAGSTVRVSVTVPESGTLVFYCAYHRDRGMVGGLTAA